MTFARSFIDQLQKSPKVPIVSAFPKGVQHNISFTEFKDWKVLYEADWGSKTTTNDIDKQVDGDILFVGAQKKSSNAIYMGAYGLRNKILKRTNDLYYAVKQENDVYW